MDNNVREREHRSLESGGKPDFKYHQQLVFVDTQVFQPQLQTVLVLLAHEAANHQRRRNTLGNRGRKTYSSGAHIQRDDEQQVEHHVDYSAADEVYQRAAGVPGGAEERVSEIVDHHERHSAEVEPQIIRSHAENALRRGHQPEYLLREKQSSSHQQESADNAEQHCRVDCPVKLGVVFRAAVARRHDVRADGNTDKQVGHEVDERGVRTYRGKRVIACKPSHDDDIGRIEKQLEKPRKHYRKCKNYHLAQHGAAAHINVFC